MCSETEYINRFQFNSIQFNSTLITPQGAIAFGLVTGTCPTGNSGCFPFGKANSHSTALPCFVFCFLPVSATLSCFHTTGCGAYSFTTDGYGIFNVRTHLGACRTHEGGSGTNKSAQELTRRDRKTVPHPAPPGDRTQGLRIWIPTHYNHWSSYDPLRNWFKSEDPEFDLLAW